jgi:hypothetical protein
MDSALKPGQWLDNLADPLHTAEDVRDLFERVEKLKVKRLAEAIRDASLN